MIKNINDNEIIITQGTTLFHGTGERFDKRQTRPGGYDDIFWTTDSSAIAQTYIPRSPSTYHINTSHILEPTTNPSLINLQRKIGINYDTSTFETDGNVITSYKSPNIFKKFNDKKYKLLSKLMAIEKLLKKYAAYADKYTYRDIDKVNKDFFKKWSKLEDLKEDILQKYRKYSSREPLFDFVNMKMKNLGYKPEEYSYTKDFNWNIPYSGDEPQSGDFVYTGRLFIVKPKRDLKLYDATNGGKREGDLMDLDYHKHEWFEMAKEKGYDGIKINDFAQSNDYGNVSHYSYGFFENTIKDLDIKEIKAKHNNLDPHFKSSNWNSPEYEKMKNIINEEINYFLFEFDNNLDYIYHGTSNGAALRIKNDGLKPNK